MKFILELRPLWCVFLDRRRLVAAALVDGGHAQRQSQSAAHRPVQDTGQPGHGCGQNHIDDQGNQRKKKQQLNQDVEAENND